MFNIYTSKAVEILFENLKTKPPFKDIGLRQELLGKINNALSLPPDSFIERIDKRPNFKIADFNNPKAMDAFFDVVKWYIDTVRCHYGKIQ